MTTSTSSRHHASLLPCLRSLDGSNRICGPEGNARHDCIRSHGNIGSSGSNRVIFGNVRIMSQQRPFSTTTPSGHKNKIRILQFQAQAQAQAQTSNRSTESLHQEASTRKNTTLFSVDSETNQWVEVPTNQTTTTTTTPLSKRTESS
eukprot:scaffold59661_cov27-Attheya_sp.AAC.2